MVRMKCPHGIAPKSNCDICLKERRQSPEYKEYMREYNRKYQQSPEYKEYHRNYMKKYSQSHREQILERQRRYHQSPKYKEYLKKYHQSSKYKEYRKNYRHLHNPKVLNPAPAKPVSLDVMEIKSRVDKPHEETGGGFTIIHMDKITDKKD